MTGPPPGICRHAAMTLDSPGPRSHSRTLAGIGDDATRSIQSASATERAAGSVCCVVVTSSKTDCGTITRGAPMTRSRPSRPALPRKISGDALTTRASNIAQFPGQILLLGHEHVDVAPGELAQKFSTAHLCELRCSFHRDRALLVPVNRCGDSDLASDFVRRFPECRKETLRHRNV
jgi:hypothetical protein